MNEKYAMIKVEKDKWEAEKEEIALYNQNKSWYSYGMYIARKTE